MEQGQAGKFLSKTPFLATGQMGWEISSGTAEGQECGWRLRRALSCRTGVEEAGERSNANTEGTSRSDNKQNLRDRMVVGVETSIDHVENAAHTGLTRWGCGRNWWPFALFSGEKATIFVTPPRPETFLSIQTQPSRDTDLRTFVGRAQGVSQQASQQALSQKQRLTFAHERL